MCGRKGLFALFMRSMSACVVIDSGRLYRLMVWIVPVRSPDEAAFRKFYTSVPAAGVE
jgi:hypothetical protein